MKAGTPEVEFVASVKTGPGIYDGILAYEDKKLRAVPIYVQEEYLNIFSWPLLHGAKNWPRFFAYHSPRGWHHCL